MARRSWWLAGLVVTCGLPGQMRRCTGFVGDENGRPIAGAAVTCVVDDQFVDTARLLAEPTTTTGKDGVWSLSVPWTTRLPMVAIAAPGRQACTLSRHSDADAIVFDDVLLPPGHVLHGRVRDSAGHAVVGAEVTVRSSLGSRVLGDCALRAGAVTDAEGIFRVPGTARVPLMVMVRHPGFGAEERPAESLTPLDYTLVATGFVRGRVVDSAGRPCGDVVVTATAADVPMQQTRSTADGAFEITAPVAGEFRLAAGEPQPPYRSFAAITSRPGDHAVELKEESRPTIALRVVERGSQVPIESFYATHVPALLMAPRSAFHHHLQNRKQYHGAAAIPCRLQETDGCVVMDAPGRAFAIVPMPADLAVPLVVQLGPEATLTGVVTARDTGKPVVGAIVLAMPPGGSTIYGSVPPGAGAVTDHEGRYRLAGLAAGDYMVQVHSPMRPSSVSRGVRIEEGATVELDLVAAAERWIEIEIEGPIPAGPRWQLAVGMRVSRDGSGFEASWPTPLPQFVTRPGLYRVGPIFSREQQVVLRRPSRTMVGATVTIDLGTLVANKSPENVSLPQFLPQLRAGQCVLPPGVPPERIAIVLTDRGSSTGGLIPARFQTAMRGNFAPLDVAGRFVFDVPDGEYWVQALDLETGILFHTEDQVIELGDEQEPLRIMPAIHWLDIDPAGAAGITVWLAQPNSECGVFLDSHGCRDGRDYRSVPLPATSPIRWLLPPGEVRLTTRAAFPLRGGGGPVAEPAPIDVTVTIDRPLHRLSLSSRSGGDKGNR